MSRPARPVDEWVEILTDWIAERPRTATEVARRLGPSRGYRPSGAAAAWDWLVAERWVVATIRERPVRVGFGVRTVQTTVWVLG